MDIIRRLMQLGFVSSICTPHIYPQLYPHNTRDNIRLGVGHLQEDLTRAGIDYTLWPGGEIRADDQIIPWLKDHGVPTLADSRCVLIDFWADKWPKYALQLFEWLLAEKYQPILAHPERIKCCCNDAKQLAKVLQMGVWLQGNLKSITGGDGYQADQLMRELLRTGQYTFLASDVHHLRSLEPRLDGMQLIAAEHGDELVDQLMSHNPRRLLGL